MDVCQKHATSFSSSLCLYCCEYYTHKRISKLRGLCWTEAADWSYEGNHGPQNWPGVCRSGKKQSPIDIASDAAINTDLGALKFVRYDFAFSGMIKNTGHTVQITLTGVPINLMGGGLPTTYVLEQIHIHWSAEHTIDGVRDPMEFHFVHYDKEFENVTSASKYPKGIAVLAVLFELSDKDNEDLHHIMKAAKLVSNWVGPSMAEIDSKVIPSLLLPKDRSTFYRYDGSLTTPGCQESVIWTVLTEKLPVSESQMKILKNVMSSDGNIKSNYRPIQELGSRDVYHHIEGYSSSSAVESSLLITVLSFFIVKLITI